jgi:triacylglycerol lipase
MEFALQSCYTGAKLVLRKMPLLRYPLLLVHGAGFRDFTLGVNYWGRIPALLEKNGVKVYYGGTDAWGTVEGNAELIASRLEELHYAEGLEKVNIIAHSRGGLEARDFISRLDRERRVASLTTMSTPHRGVKAMDVAMKFPLFLWRIAAWWKNTGAKLKGDLRPDFSRSSRELSQSWCKKFNERTPDRPDVYYQSYATELPHWYSDAGFIPIRAFIKWTDGPSDGLCPVESARWGSFRGVIKGKRFGVSHACIVDIYRSLYKDVDIPGLYLDIVKDLARRGF